MSDETEIDMLAISLLNTLEYCPRCSIPSFPTKKVSGSLIATGILSESEWVFSTTEGDEQGTATPYDTKRRSR